jgi:arsenite methyltransferase
MSDQTKQDTRDKVRSGYAEIARSGEWASSPSASDDGCCSGGGCCGPAVVSAEDVALAVGYEQRDLASIPEGANMGLSCGNPTAIASLAEGEVVVDLGSGGGFDCFLAGPRVGASGRVIGVDMTPEMVSRARGNLESYRKQSGLENVEFRLGEIEHLPVADASVDVAISNCVLNLSPDQEQVWRDLFRVLKPGGRAAVSDLALREALPASIASDVEALVGCVAGARLIEDVRAMAEAAGFVDVRIEEKPAYIESMAREGDPLYEKIRRELPEDATIDQYVTSVDITARRPE